MSDTRTTTADRPGDQGGVADRARDRARDVADRGKHDASEVARVAKSETAQLAHRTSSEARRRAEEQAGNLATMLGGLADELDEVASASSERGGHVAGMARDGASLSRRAAERLDQGGVDAVLDDVRGFARRRPAMFLAASFGVGLLLGRFTRNADLGQLAQDARDAGSGNGDEDESLAGARQPAFAGVGPTGTGQPDSGIGTGSSSTRAAPTNTSSSQDGPR